VAAWAVPAVESLVPILTLLGRERAAAAVALVSVAVFSIALLRSAARDGVRVPCGCFGRASIDVRVALTRDLALAAAAFVSFALATSDPALKVPQASDALPALLLAGGLAMATITAWRATVWLGRGRA
jgi:hypothetical protein